MAHEVRPREDRPSVYRTEVRAAKAAGAIHSCIDIADLEQCLEEHLVHEGERSYSVLLRDTGTGRISSLRSASSRALASAWSVLLPVR